MVRRETHLHPTSKPGQTLRCPEQILGFHALPPSVPVPPRRRPVWQQRGPNGLRLNGLWPNRLRLNGLRLNGLRLYGLWLLCLSGMGLDRIPGLGELPLLQPSVAMAQSGNQAISVRASLDAKETTVGQPVGMTIEVEGGEASLPAIPRIPGAVIQYTGQQTSFKSINFSFSRQVTFNFMLTPQREGIITVPPLTVDVSGQTLQTRQLTLNVVPRAQARPQGGNQALDQDGNPSALPSDEDVKVEAELDPRKVYVGQAIQQTLRILYAVPTADNISVQRRPVPGTIDEPLNDSAQSRSRRLIDGVQYTVEEARWMFYPTTAGPLKVPSMDITVPVLQRARRQRQVDPFFDNFFNAGLRAVPRDFQTDEQTITVLPLPTQGRPADFSGLVGEFTLASHLSSRDVKLGESITQTIIVSGQGNLRSVTLPPVSIPQMKVYDDKPEVQIEVDGDGRVFSQKIFKRALVPQVAGSLTLPPVQLSVFDPKLEQYDTLTSKEETLTVAPGANGETSLSNSPVTAAAQAPEKEGTSAPKPAMKLPEDDILPLHTGETLTRDEASSLFSPSSLALLLAPPALFSVLVLVQRSRNREDDPQLKRKKQAAQTARSSLKSLPSDGSARLDQLSKTLRTYLGDKLGCEGGSLTPSEAESRLLKAKVTPALAGEVAACLRSLDEARYAPGGSGSLGETLKHQLEGLIQRLEKETVLR